MSRLVLDVMFLETLQFRMLVDHYRVCAIAPSREEVLRRCLESKGIELIDYDSWTVQPLGSTQMIDIRVYSRAYRERLERATASR